VSDNTVLAVFGRKGSGKSTLVKAITREHSRVIVFDALGEYGEGSKQIAFGFDACLKALEANVKAPKCFLSLRLRDTGDYYDLMEVVFEMPGTLFVLEETSLYCSPSVLPPELSALVRYGRHRGLDQIYIARRPSEVHRDLTAQADVIVSFEQREPRDLDYLRAATGEECDSLRTMKKYRCQAWGDLSKAPLAVIEATDRPARPHDQTTLDLGGDRENAASREPLTEPEETE